MSKTPHKTNPTPYPDPEDSSNDDVVQHTYRGYKISISRHGELISIERIFEHPQQKAADLFLGEQETHLVEWIFSCLEWKKDQLIEVLDRAFSKEYCYQ